MTAAVYRTPPTLLVPLSQNTAPVLEHNCLFTHDLRKKQKKWQDGFLRYHTFNKRIMVYDVPRNYIGDTHWLGDEAIRDGDELRLDKNGVLVQVAEEIGRTETDISELRKSAKKQTCVKSSPMRGLDHTAMRSSSVQAPLQAKHRSLNVLLGVRRGPTGKAMLPTKSPFEERHRAAEEQDWQGGRLPKRPRIETAAHSSVSTLTTGAKPPTKNKSRGLARAAVSRRQEDASALSSRQPNLGVTNPMDVFGEDGGSEKFLPGFSSDVLGPGSSPVRPATSAAWKQKATPSSPPAFQTQQVHSPLRRSRVTGESASRRVPPLGVMTGDTISPVVPEKQKELCPSTKSVPGVGPNPAQTQQTEVDIAARRPKPSDLRAVQTLRLASAMPKKKTLLCQQLLPSKRKRVFSVNSESATENWLDLADTTQPQQKSASERFTERLAKIDRKNGSTAMSRFDTSGNESHVRRRSVHADHTVDLTEHVNPQATNAINENPTISGGNLDIPKRSPASRSASDIGVVPFETCSDLVEVASSKDSSEPHSEQHPKATEVDVDVPRNTRAPCAPVRGSPSPVTNAHATPRTAGQTTDSLSKSKEGRHLVSKVLTRAKQKTAQKSTVRMNTAAQGTSAVVLSKPFQAPTKPTLPQRVETPVDAGPWSRDAFDLFTWRPPGWDEERWCVGAHESGT